MTNYDREEPLVSIVILNYNGKEFTKKCLESVLNNKYVNFEVIFVDNASTDGSLEFAQELFGSDKRLKMVRNHKNLGYCEGNNFGVRATKGKYIVFLNNDTEVDPDWVVELVRILESSPEICAAQSKLLLMDDRRRINSAGGFLDPFGFSHTRGGGEKDDGQYDFITDVFFSSGASMIIKKSVLAETGLFDPRFFMYYDETDLCWRLHLRGYKIVFVPKSVVYHADRGIAKKQLPEMTTFHMCKNHVAILTKNYQLRNLIKYLMPYIFIVFVYSSYLIILKRQKSTSKAYARALLWDLLNLRYLWRERQNVQTLIRRVPDKNVSKYMWRLRTLREVGI